MTGGEAASAGAPGRQRLSASAAVWLANPHLPEVLLGVAVLVSGVLLVALNSQLVFFIDDWEVLLHRRGFDAEVFLKSHANHPTIGIAVVYKAIQAVFGMSSVTPYSLASTLVFLASAVLLFVWMRRRVGGWLALAGAVSILFLGTAYEDLLSPFQIGYFAPVACGLGALLALERGKPRDYAICCGLLVLGLSFQTVGLAFVAGVAVALALDGELRRRAWVPAVPVVLYGLWYLGYGGEDPTQLTFENLATAPAFVLDGFAASVSSLVGFATPEDGELGWGRALLAALIVLAAIRLLTLRGVPKGLWVVLVIGVAFWAMTALNASFFRSADTSRYQYLGAVFVLMAAAELARGVRPSPRVLAIAFVALAAAVAANVSNLRDAYLDLKALTPVVRGDLAALEIAADRVDPDLVLTPKNSGFNYFTFVDAGSYLSAAEEFGSPAYALAELEAAPESARAAADKVLYAALEPRLEPIPLAATDAIACTPLAGSGDPASAAALPVGGAILRAPGGGQATLRLRRYATESSLPLGRLRGGEAAALEIPADRSQVPWQLSVAGSARVELCGQPAASD